MLPESQPQTALKEARAELQAATEGERNGNREKIDEKLRRC
jgi:hypothetical protein